MQDDIQQGNYITSVYGIVFVNVGNITYEGMKGVGS